MGNGISKKSNNQGSTLIMVLIIVSFIAILGTVCTATAMVNFKMKAVDRDSKKAFYTDEQAVDEIYSGLGKLSMEKLNDAYQKEMASMVTASKDLTSQNIKTSNQDANKNLRLNFTSNMLNELIQDYTNIWQSNIGVNLPFDSNKLIMKLNTFLEDPTKAKVIKVGSFYTTQAESLVGTKLAVYKIVFKDCVVEYKNDKGFFSDVTFDGVIALKDVEIQFTEDQKDMLTSFEDYSLIGNTGIDIADDTTLNFNGNMYAGGPGLNLETSSTMNASNSTIVSSQDIKLTGAKLKTVGSSNIWCSSIIAMKGSKSTINIDNICNTYVEDDLQIDGDGSEVNVSGSYYGYSYEGDTATDNGHSKSSAIIVNGKGASINLSKIATLVLGGRAYIDFQSGTAAPYMTGESLALKGDQEAYLVPGSLITNTVTNKPASNPYSKELTTSINITADNFFGYQYLDAKQPFTKVTVTNTNQVYVYLNFSSKANSASYFKAILNDTVFDQLCQSIKSNATVYQAYQDTRNYMKSILQMNLGQLLQTSIFDKSTTAQIYTNGSLMNSDFGTNPVLDNPKDYTLTDNASPTKDAFALNAMDLSNRYSLITKTLYSPSMYKITNGAIEKDASGNPIRDLLHSYDVNHDIIINGKDIDISGMGSDVYANIINSTYLNEHDYYSSDHTYGSNIMYVAKGNVTVSNTGFFAGFTGGVIVASGTVKVEKDFQGLIIAGGKIFINNNVKIDGGISGSTVDAFLKSDAEMKKYFNVWNSVKTSAADGSGSISGVTFKDIIKFENWSKTGVATVE
ncbi:hypothetical protein [[Clostridium] fimetarium]|uniref:PilX N-terminal n=1 Tax=[Clostridium] fimetarium TaxID=99656 RepID=A0A1I0N088_9FIRM|nr:hypothetical protein [[Clostridium] fimetarium]SEV94456.1 hypothetical protein SAMN05421659_102290 [[Clostridium] fimetarium]